MTLSNLSFVLHPLLLLPSLSKADRHPVLCLGCGSLPYKSSPRSLTSPWFFLSEECLNMDFSSSSSEWLRLDLPDFSCIFQVVSKHHNAWHSMSSKWRSAYFLSLCWGMQRRHFHGTSGWNGYHEPQQLQQLQNPGVCFDKIYRFHHYLLSHMGDPLDYTTSKVYPTLLSYIWKNF